jgi:hypothetical protein
MVSYGLLAVFEGLIIIFNLNHSVLSSSIDLKTLSIAVEMLLSLHALVSVLCLHSV